MFLIHMLIHSNGYGIIRSIEGGKLGAHHHSYGCRESPAAGNQLSRTSFDLGFRIALIAEPIIKA